MPRIKSWGELDLNYKIVAQIDQEKCIHCGLCYIACEDGCHQSIRWDRIAHGRIPGVARLAQRRDLVRAATRSLPGAGGDVINLFYDQGRHLRRLQHVQPGLPGRGLHHDARGRHGLAADELEPIPGEAGRGEVDPIEPPQHV